MAEANHLYPNYVLPSNPTCMVEDPLSICEQLSDQLKVPKWELITALLQRKCVQNLEALFDTISSLQHDLEFETLRLVMEDEKFMNLREFFEKTYPAMVKIAMKMPELFPSGELEALKPSEFDCRIAYTREQVACLLVHMFLCTISTPPRWNKFWANFGVWYNSKSRPVIAYIKSLLTYFSQLDVNSFPDNAKEEITFHRKILTSPPNWSSSTTPISTAVTITTLATNPGQNSKTDNAEVIFANKDISFGTSGTQEEAKLAMSSETCIIVLLAPTLGDMEVISIRGAKRFACYEGIGREVTFSGPCVEKQDWTKCSVIAMDALEIDLESDWSVLSELEENNVQRELNKAFCGFTSHDLGISYVSIATGHWGCGSFGGNKYVKALVQLMAASEAKTSLLFRDNTAKPCSHDPSIGSCELALESHDTATGSCELAVGSHDIKTEFSKHFMVMLLQLEGAKVTVGQLYQALQDMHKYCELNYPTEQNLFTLTATFLEKK